MSTTPIWGIEGIALDSTGDLVADSLADVVLGISTATADVADIKAVTDALPDAGALTSIAQQSDLEDTLAEAEEIERHLHSRGHWYGKDPGDTFLLENGLVSWRLTAGAGGAFGNWVQLSNGDEISDPYYDPHLLMVTAASAAGKLYYIQFGTGAGGSQAVSGMSAFFPAATLRQSPAPVQHTRIASTSLWWARCSCETDGATIDLVVGLHTYLE